MGAEDTMILCDFARVDDSNDFRCKRCGDVLRQMIGVGRIVQYCNFQDRAGPPILPTLPSDGPGTQLKKLFQRLGIAPEAGCKCNARAAEMDRQGPQWCRDKIDRIVSWLRDEFERQKKSHAWRAVRHEKDPTKPHPGPLPLPLRLPFSKTAAKTIINLAIRRAEKAAAAMTTSQP